jgi:8-oxo-dGTP diphosphatase
MKNTTLCYLEKDNSYLMLHRIKKKNDINFDKWIGIGGKFEDKESPEDCVIREAFEETGLRIKPRYRGIVTFVSEEFETEWMHLFTATEFSGEIKECEEGVLEWIDKKELLSKQIWEGDRIFLKLLEDDAPFFSLKLSYRGDSLIEAVLNGEKIR